jgi:hypothetical protein
LSDFSIIDRKKIRVIIYEGLSKAKRKEEKEFIM